ncbi:MAG: hypothetical protein AB7E42_00080 [Anaerotignaceae bacterium]
MSNIEEAIEWLIQIAADENKEYVEMAIQALQDKIKVGKGCEFCNSEEIDEAVAYTAKLTDSSEVIDINFNYCPMCGRKLVER